MSEGEPASAPSATPARRACAFAVHVFTASGAAFALLALLAAVEGRWTLMFAWLGAALVVDGVDGTIARRVGVAELLPRWSGDTLDLVVDFLTYVFVPAYAIVAGGLLPPSAAIPAGIAIVVIERALFRRPHHENGRQQLPRVSGAVERCGVLSVHRCGPSRGSPWAQLPRSRS